MKHRSEYAGPNSKSTAWIVYISMIKADCPKTISYSYFPFCFLLPTPELSYIRGLHYNKYFCIFMSVLFFILPEFA